MFLKSGRGLLPYCLLSPFLITDCSSTIRQCFLERGDRIAHWTHCLKKLLITLLVCCAVALCTEVVAEAVPRGAGDVEIPSCSPGGCVTLPSPFYLADCSGEAVQQTEVCMEKQGERLKRALGKRSRATMVVYKQGFS